MIDHAVRSPVAYFSYYLDTLELKTMLFLLLSDGILPMVYKGCVPKILDIAGCPFSG